MISLIAAVAKNNVIGIGNTLPWNIPEDMKFFKAVTDGHCVITGRKNYESIPMKFRPLKNRTNIVITRQADYSAPGATVVANVEDAIKAANETGDSEIFIIGGGEIYKQCIGFADKLYITHVDEEFDGDVHFPEIGPEWSVSVEVTPVVQSTIPFRTLVYEKTKTETKN